MTETDNVQASPESKSKNETKEAILVDKDEKPEHPVFEVIKKTDPGKVIEAVRNFFEVDGVSIEIEDNSGMTPLMHACWKGNLELAKFLIKQVRSAFQVGENR